MPARAIQGCSGMKPIPEVMGKMQEINQDGVSIHHSPLATKEEKAHQTTFKKEHSDVLG